MKNYWKVEIPGNPIAKKRPRVVRNKHTGFVHGFNPQTDDEYTFATVIKTSDPVYYDSEALKIRVTFYLPIPKSFSKKKTKEALEGALYPTKRPDVDNYLKFVLDCCNSVLFRDDSQVVTLIGRKRYSEVPKTVIEVIVL